MNISTSTSVRLSVHQKLALFPAVLAAQNGNKAVVKAALRHGAIINMTNCVGNTALHFANEFKYQKLATYLVSKGANPDI